MATFFRIRNRTVTYCFIMACVVLSAVAPLAAQTTGPRFYSAPHASHGAHSSQSSNAPHASQPSYFGVMGDVPAPGVYEWLEKNPLLIDVVQRAGGLKETASGNIRIVRNGRGGQLAFYSPQLDFRLLPGDVVIAEAAPGSPRSPDAPVQLAFLDLLDQPVVLKLRPHHANVRAIVALLNQPPEVAESVRVLTSNPRPDRAAATSDSLRTGSVLVFSRLDLRPDRIPNNLPQPRRFDSELATGERPTARTESESHVARPAPRELAEVAGTAATPITDVTRPADPVGSSLPAMIGGAADERDLIEDADGSGSASMDERADGAFAQITPRRTAIAATTPPAAASASPRGTIGDESSASTDGGSTRSASGPSSRAMTIAALLGGLAILSGTIVWIVARRRRQRGYDIAASSHVPEERAAAPPRTRRRSLEDLISGELEVRERPVALPESVELHGRPTGHRTLRIDAAHAASADRGGRAPGKARGTDHAAVAGALLRPHFLTKNRAAARSVAAAVKRPGANRAASRVELAMAAARNHVASAQPAPPVVPTNRDAGPRADERPIDPFQIGLLDRVLSTVHGAHRP